ncbi:HAD-IIB family hydrolase [Spiroplasma endosymbiont of Aspidapion aeneum]|uniref:HAD-IIB family hydrolase n=1 Tax=Spiroplasma endosymbiont of Aspidapion aeneum TaxID=3066276 RepID=UPI00313E4B6A
MKNNIQLIALDMDGTSFHRAGGIVDHNIQPIKKAEEQGVKVVFVTGRPLNCDLNNDLFKHDMVNNDTLIVGFNGALIKNLLTNEVLHQEVIKKDIVNKVFKAAKKYKDGSISLWCYLIDEFTAVVNKPIKGDSYLEGENRFLKGNAIVYHDDMKLTDAYKFIIGTNEEGFIKDLNNLGLTFYGQLGKNSEVVSTEASKGKALEYLSKKYNISPKNMLSVGDAENDIPMLEYTDFSFAPSNASEKTKQSAKFVCDLSNTEGAIAKIIEDFVIEGENKNEN